jgi:hypothetical protein
MVKPGTKNNGHVMLTVRRSDFLKEYMVSEERSQTKYRDEGAPALPRNTILAQTTARSSGPPSARSERPPSARLVGSVWVPAGSAATEGVLVPQTSARALSTSRSSSGAYSARSGRSGGGYTARSGTSSSYSSMSRGGGGGAAMLTSRKKALEAELKELENVMGAKKREAAQLGRIRAERPFAIFPLSARTAQESQR